MLKRSEVLLERGGIAQCIQVPRGSLVGVSGWVGVFGMCVCCSMIRCEGGKLAGDWQEIGKTETTGLVYMVHA